MEVWVDGKLLGNMKVEDIASFCLEGFLLKYLDNLNCKEVKLVFPQTTIEWKNLHGGPDSLVIYEHNIPLLLESILRLIDKGIKVIVDMPSTLKQSING